MFSEHFLSVGKKAQEGAIGEMKIVRHVMRILTLSFKEVDVLEMINKKFTLV